MARSIGLVLAAALLFSGCGKDGGENTGVQSTDSPLMRTELLETHDPTGMKLVTQNARFALLLDPRTADFAVLNKSSGQTVFSDPLLSESGLLFPEELEESKARSALIVNYLNGAREVKQFNSYDDCVKLEQTGLYQLAGGVRLLYTMGQDPGRFLLPEAMTVSFYEALLDKLDAAGRKTLGSSYMLLESQALVGGKLSYIDSDYYLSKFTALRSQDLYCLRDITPGAQERLVKVLKAAELTAGQLEEQRRLTGAAAGEPAENIVIPLDLTLCGDGLRAEIDLSLVSVTKGITLLDISVLPGFYAMRGDGDYIVPDGSGALVPIRQAGGQIYAQPLYGTDKSKTNTAESIYTSQAVLPFYGVLPVAKGAMLTVIDEGAAMAKIFAEPADGGGLSRAYAQFTVTDWDYRTDGASGEAERKLVTAPGPQTGKLALRYFLLDKPADYSKLAAAFRDFLRSAGRLPKKDPSPPKLYLDLYGYTQKPSRFMGFDRRKDQVFTSFSDAEAIFQQLYQSGVKGLSARYLGVANGGLLNTNGYQLQLSASLGGRDGLRKLQKKASELGYTVYPDLVLNYVYRKTMLDRYSVSGDTPRALDGTAVSDALLNRALNMPGEKLIRFPLTVKKAQSNLETLLPDLERLNIKTVSFSTIGNELQSDFSRRAYTPRVEAQRAAETLLERTEKEGVHFLVDTGNLYALKYADGVLNLPAGGSGLNLEARSIPFVQIVLSGSIDYALTPFNKTGDAKVQRLRAIECGAQVYFGMMAADNLTLRNTQFEHLYSLNAGYWLPKAAEAYRYVEEALSAVRDAQIQEHRALSGEVFETRWDNGVSVLVNYGDKDFERAGTLVPAGGYAVEGGKAS